MTERMGARLSFHDGKTSPGQLHLDWGRVEWDDAWDEKLASGDLDGTRWRFGKDFWTTLDTSVDLTLGDATIPAGHHFLVLARRADGRFALIVLDPERIRTHAFDPSVAHLTPFVGGTEIPLAHRRVEGHAPVLLMEFVPGEGDGTEGTLRVRFGPHELRVEYGVALGERKESDESKGEQGRARLMSSRTPVAVAAEVADVASARVDRGRRTVTGARRGSGGRWSARCGGRGT